MIMWFSYIDIQLHCGAVFSVQKKYNSQGTTLLYKFALKIKLNNTAIK